MGLRIEEGMICRPNQDKNGPSSHPYLILSIPQPPFHAQEFIQCMSLTSMNGKEVTTELPVYFEGRISYVAPYGIHSFNFNDFPSSGITGFGAPKFMSWNEFKSMLSKLYYFYLIGDEYNEAAEKLRLEYRTKFYEQYPNAEEYREIKKNTFTPVSKAQAGTQSDPNFKKPIINKPTNMSISSVVDNGGRNNVVKREDKREDKPSKHAQQCDVQFITKKGKHNKNALPESMIKKEEVPKMLVDSSCNIIDQLNQLVNLFKQKGITATAIKSWDKDMTYTFVYLYNQYGCSVISSKLGLQKSRLYSISYQARERGRELGIALPGK